MIFSGFEGLAWFMASLLFFLLVQRWLHRELQAVFLLLTRKPALSIGLFSLVFFPGVLLHEASHFIMARLLQVRTGGFSLIPKVLPNGTLRLGYVETAATDVFRDALIGTAPLISGAAVVGLLGATRLGFLPLADFTGQGQWQTVLAHVPAMVRQPDFWLWFYLAFAISSTMLPSNSDRRAWLPMGIGFGILLILAGIAGAGPWMMSHLGPALNRFLLSLGLVFGLSLALHVLLVIPVWGLRHAISRLTGLRVV
ncbi:MAG TPA: hypothetical protein VFF68_09695 [Anaerolineaceae bacterium]|nr:hypothetical protein [Anaerolineaceae bacterium]